MSTEPTKIFQVAPAVEDFTVWPYLDTLYRWMEAQSWYAEEMPEAWRRFSAGAPSPNLDDPDQHDRLLRFWAWFALDRPLAAGDRPIERFVKGYADDLTAEGRAIYERLTQTVYGVFRVQRTVPGRLALFEDMASGTRYGLHERALTEELQRGDLVIGRLYPFGEAYVADPDVHIGHVSEAPQNHRIDPLEAETRYYADMVPAKGPVLDVLDALLLQVDSPLTADDVFDMLRDASSLEDLLRELYGTPVYRLRYLHMRDRSLLDELMQELWETSGPLEEANLRTEDAAALTRTVRAGLRAIAEGDQAGLEALLDPQGFLPLYLELFGVAGLQRLADVTGGAPGAALRARHQLMPKDGGIFTLLEWGKDTDKHAVGVVSHATPDGQWKLVDLSPPDGATPAMLRAYEHARDLGFVGEPADDVEARLRAAIEEVGYSVHDTIDLLRLWREFKELAEPDISQPSIWAAGVELLDSRYRNENLELKVLARSHGVMPRAIEDAADAIDAALRAHDEAQK
ncbi:MAG TPA: hypothetical protein V6D47_05300 [Oscillatoriaceae cyanobacterium]